MSNETFLHLQLGENYKITAEIKGEDSNKNTVTTRKDCKKRGAL